MIQTITPIDNTIYVEREYSSKIIEDTLSNSVIAQNEWGLLTEIAISNNGRYVAFTKNNGNREVGSFPYLVKKDICLNSQKMTIDLPILEALRIEAENYWLSR